MPYKISATIHVFHLENALFCAEQCVVGEVDFLEISNLLLKNVGLHCIKFFRERFPDMSFIVDAKSLQPEEQEWEAIAKAGAHSITISAAISPEHLQTSLQLAKQYNLETILDFRGCNHDLLVQQIHLANQTDKIILEGDSSQSNIEILLQQITSHTNTPIIMHHLADEQEMSQIFTLGAQQINLLFHESNFRTAKETVQNIKTLLKPLEKEADFIRDWKTFHEQTLQNKLNQITPTQISEVYEKPIYLEKVYPLLRFTRIAGKAYTIKVWPGDHKTVEQALLHIPEKSIVLIDAGGSGPAVWGAIATEIAIKQNITAAIIYGSMTEVNHSRSKNFPCYMTSIHAMTTNKEGMAQINIPIQIGNVTIHPGD